MVWSASASGPSERDLMVEQLRLLRKLNGYKTPGTPVMMAHRLALEQVAYPCQHVQALDETEDLVISRRGDAPLASAWYNYCLETMTR
jgi:hypothetical protein